MDDSTTNQTTRCHERLSKYYAACDPDRMGIHPFCHNAITTDGALGPAAQKLMDRADRLAVELSTKWKASKGVVMGWIPARLAMADFCAARA